MIEKPYKLVNAPARTLLPFSLVETPLEPVIGPMGVYSHVLSSMKASGEDLTARRALAPDGQDRSGEPTPCNNMGVKSTQTGPEEGKARFLEEFKEEFRVRPNKFGNAQIYWVTRAAHEANPRAAFIDWLNFTFGEEAYKGAIANVEIMSRLSADLEKVLGYGITRKMPAGRNFYDECWELGEGFGFVCMGGKRQRETILVMINGTGCMAAKTGWEQQMYEWAPKLPRAQISRADCAHDDYTGGQYSVDQALQDYHDGGFNAGGRNPDIEQRGNWIKPNGKGRTFYVGARGSGKFTRVYEKGKQLGECESPWVRIECEFGNKNRIIPWDILINPGQYLAAAYPAFAWICQEQERIKTKQASIKTIYEKAIQVIRKQFGAYLWVIQQVEGSADQAMKRLMREEYPERLVVPDWQNAGMPIHRRVEPDHDDFGVLDGEYALA